MSVSLVEALRAHQVHVESDNPFQRRARLLQALWRESQGLPVGLHRGQPLGSRIPMPFAEATLANYLTDTIRAVVRREVADPARSAEKLYGKPRIFEDLLSSQPLCFNLFGELQQDLGLATRALRRLWPDRVSEVVAVDFEHSPGRSDPTYTADRSAFDVFITCKTPRGAAGFVGVEVKYHESMKDRPAPHRPAYDEIAAAMGVFRADGVERLKRSPLQQIWRDHLLSGALVRRGGYEAGLLVLLYPADNAACARAAAAYEACLRGAQGETGFEARTLEAVAAAIRAETAAPWIDALVERYLRFEKVEQRLGAARRQVPLG